MYLEPDIYERYSFIFAFLPLITAFIMYCYINLKLKDGVKNILSYLVVLILFFLSVYLIAEKENIFPITKIWIINQNNNNLIKSEKISLFTSSYIFKNNMQGIVKPYQDFAVINNTDQKLWVDINFFATVKPGQLDQFSLARFHNIINSRRKKIIIKPYSVAYTMKLNYFGYGKEKPPAEKMITYTKNKYGYTDIMPKTEITYWLRWEKK